MSYVTTEEFQREGRAVNGEMLALNDAVDRTTAKQKSLGPQKVPFPDGPWWQRWQGFYGAWTQYYEEQVKPTPVMPVHDDGDVVQWGKDLDQWKADFHKGEAVNASHELAGPLNPSNPKGDDSGGSGASSALTYVAVLLGLGIVGYALSSAANLKRAFT